MAKKAIYYLLSLALLSGVFIFSHSSVEAAAIKLNPSTVNATTGTSFTVDIVVDPTGDQITTTDAYITYDTSYLEATSVTPGTYFPQVSTNISAGKVYVSGFVNPGPNYLSTSGTLATITFNPLKNGSTAAQVYCSATANNSSKVTKYGQADSTNILNCAQNVNSTITIGGSSTTTTSSTPTPTAAAATTTYNNPTTTTPSTQTTTAKPVTLPQTGAVEDTIRIIASGIILVFVGWFARIYAKKLYYIRK